MNHNQHRKVDIQEAAKEKKVQRIKIVNRAKADAVFLEAKVKEQRRLINESEKEVVAAKNKVTGSVEEIIGRLREHEAEMRTKLTEINETQQREQTTCLTDLQESIKSLNALIEYDEGVLQKSTVLEILQADNAAFSLREEGLNTQEIKIYTPRHVNYVLDQETLNISRPLVLGKVVTSYTDPSKSAAEGPGLMEVELGFETNLKVTTRDSQGNQFFNKEDQVIVKICIPGEENEKEDIEDIEDCKDGSYTVRYKPKTLGLHYVKIEVNGQPLTGSPWSIQVTPHRYTFTRSLPSGVTALDAFVFPWSIALNDRTEQIAIAGYSNKCIQLFDSQGKHVKTIGGSGRQNSLTIGHPMSLAFLRNNDLIFTHEKDGHVEQMSVYTAHGPSIRNFGKHVVRPLSVFMKTESDVQVVVSDVGDKKIKVLSPDLKDLLQSFSPPECNETAEFVFHKNGTFFASYMRLHCVKVFSDEGVFLYDIGSFGSGDGQLNRPVGLAVDAFNQLIVCDNGNRRVQVLTLNGEFLYSITNEDIDNLAPWFVTVSNNSEILISDVRKHCVYVFR